MAEKKPAWPSVEEQLAAHKIVRGSALEHLVRDNQDFHMLRPEEASDSLPYPPWLRVYWRKQHPGSRHAPGDPTGGYPGVLETILAMMVQNQDKPEGTARPPAASTGPTSHSGPKRHGGKHEL
jgi:hypothetical protein